MELIYLRSELKSSLKSKKYRTVLNLPSVNNSWIWPFTFISIQDFSHTQMKHPPDMTFTRLGHFTMEKTTWVMPLVCPALFGRVSSISLDASHHLPSFQRRILWTAVLQTDRLHKCLKAWEHFCDQWRRLRSSYVTQVSGKCEYLFRLNWVWKWREYCNERARPFDLMTILLTWVVILLII
jgi:hypothetical protein